MTADPGKPSEEQGRSWPGVSVVMPVRNEERHLRISVRRVLDQHYEGELEVIMAIGPSRDRTHDIAADLAYWDRAALERDPVAP